MTFNRTILMAELERDEGRRLKPYVDTVGKVSIGIGRNLTDVGITDYDCAKFLNEDIAAAEAGLDKLIYWWRTLDDVRQRAMVNWIFNCGAGGLATFTHTLAALKEERWAEAAAGMRASLWRRQVGERAERLAKMIETGEA